MQSQRQPTWTIQTALWLLLWSTASAGTPLTYTLQIEEASRELAEAETLQRSNVEEARATLSEIQEHYREAVSPEERSAFRKIYFAETAEFLADQAEALERQESALQRIHEALAGLDRLSGLHQPSPAIDPNDTRLRESLRRQFAGYGTLVAQLEAIDTSADTADLKRSILLQQHRVREGLRQGASLSLDAQQRQVLDQLSLVRTLRQYLKDHLVRTQLQITHAQFLDVQVALDRILDIELGGLDSGRPPLEWLTEGDEMMLTEPALRTDPGRGNRGGGIDTRLIGDPSYF